MNPKVFFLILLGSCLSFALIFGLMTTLFMPDAPARRPKPRPAAQVQPAPKPLPAPTLSNKPVLPRAAAPVAEPLPTATPAPVNREIAQAKKAIDQQIAALKKSRDRMLSDLALELKSLSPAQAAVHLDQLDSETTALVLQRLPKAQRQKIRKALSAAKSQSKRK